MGYICILSEDGTRLMPTLRKSHVQKLLKRGKARVVEYVPFVVQLKYSTPGITQPLYGGTDPGRTNIGNAVIDGSGTVVYKDHVTTRNREVAKLMAERRRHRQASRRGERLARKRLAKRLGTTMKAMLERVLPGAEFLYGGERCIKSGQSNGGKYFRAVGYGERNFPVRKCTVVKENRGLVNVL